MINLIKPNLGTRHKTNQINGTIKWRLLFIIESEVVLMNQILLQNILKEKLQINLKTKIFYFFLIIKL